MLFNKGQGWHQIKHLDHKPEEKEKVRGKLALTVCENDFRGAK
jgi:hypothetical protein